jgi:hypothetical protein
MAGSNIDITTIAQCESASLDVGSKIEGAGARELGDGAAVMVMRVEHDTGQSQSRITG